MCWGGWLKCYPLIWNWTHLNFYNLWLGSVILFTQPCLKVSKYHVSPACSQVISVPFELHNTTCWDWKIPKLISLFETNIVYQTKNHHELIIIIMRSRLPLNPKATLAHVYDSFQINQALLEVQKNTVKVGHSPAEKTRPTWAIELFSALESLSVAITW